MHMIHRWHEADSIGVLKSPTRMSHFCQWTMTLIGWDEDCFFKKDEKWYYAGRYIGMQLAPLTSREWDELAKEVSLTLRSIHHRANPSIQVKSAILKECLSDRRNISPQVIFETGQLHHVGALRVACVGLQCVGFDMVLYKAIVDAAKKATTTGNWAAPWSAGADEKEKGSGLGIAE
jgi:hypothetical protein